MDGSRMKTPNWKLEFKKQWNEVCKTVKDNGKEAGIDLKKIKLSCRDKYAEYNYM